LFGLFLNEFIFYDSIDETTTVHGHSTHKSSQNGHQRENTANRIRQVSSGISSVEKNRSTTALKTTPRHKRDLQNENLQLAITELLNHFSHRNLDAIVRVIKMTLEKLRRRITSTLSYGNQKIR
jgi:hypothetical protein